jgi:hypothetical protein
MHFSRASNIAVSNINIIGSKIKIATKIVVAVNSLRFSIPKKNIPTNAIKTSIQNNKFAFINLISLSLLSN